VARARGRQNEKVTNQYKFCNLRLISMEVFLLPILSFSLHAYFLVCDLQIVTDYDFSSFFNVLLL